MDDNTMLIPYPHYVREHDMIFNSKQLLQYGEFDKLKLDNVTTRINAGLSQIKNNCKTIEDDAFLINDGDISTELGTIIETIDILQVLAYDICFHDTDITKDESDKYIQDRIDYLNKKYGTYTDGYWINGIKTKESDINE